MAELLSVPVDSGRLTIRHAPPALLVRAGGIDGAVLHWGFLKYDGGAWGCPPPESRPSGTEVHDAHAARTPLPDGQDVAIPLPPAGAWRALAFVIHQPHKNRWHKNGNGDFTLPLPAANVAAAHEKNEAPSKTNNRRTPADTLASAFAFRPGTIQLEDLGNGQQLAWAVAKNGNEARACFAATEAGPLYLHWALSNRGASDWNRPALEHCPPGTVNYDDKAVRTPFDERDGLRVLDLRIQGNAEAQDPAGLNCVFFQSETNRWLKAGGRDLFVPLFRKVAPSPITDGRVRGLADTIVRSEVEYLSWTLMHRYNLCCDLLDGVEDNPQALALLFVWLRYSALRQLDWQRHYNTKPRDLSHAQDRLTLRLAALWRQQPSARIWARRMLTTLGRGGDGQKIRDEILQIMHRNHIGEKSGTFLEEWHQKLHNNTTPDDVPICEAYLVFLRSNGKLDEFYKTLEAGGVTRQRLLSFERSIKTEPVLFAGKKEALIGEFENFLRILKSVHLGTDLETALNAAKPHLDAGVADKLRKLLKSKPSSESEFETAAVLAARNAVAERLHRGGSDAVIRDLLYLDLALESRLRAQLEAMPLSHLPLERLTALALLALESVQRSESHPEFELCLRHFERVLKELPDGLPAGRDWALHARSVTERMHRCVQQRADETYQSLQPLAEYLGGVFNAAGWTIELFSEEVVRAGPTFPLSLLLQRTDPLLREAAGIGGWQIISPHPAHGRVQYVPALMDVQEQAYAEPTVLVTPHVSGNEEIPAGVTAVLTTDAPDLVSHVSVRARNAGVLFATCFEKPVFESLKQFAAQTVLLQVTPAGDVVIEAGAAVPAPETAAAPSAPAPVPAVRVPAGAPWILLPAQYTRDLVGGKSSNLNGLRGRVAEWIQFPASMTLPFGTFERVLDAPVNRDIKTEIAARVLAATNGDPLPELRRVREAILKLHATLELKDALHEAWTSAGLPALEWPDAWRGITRVWASKWTDRAFFSRRARGVPHENLLMAVLVQQVVEADYAFVIHTANPINGRRNEIYAEVVCGLGETLVGNYPGRALGFVFNKNDRSIRIASFPSKSEGLYGRGVIFRSDSNGEDLQGFAGAGLYDSVLAHEPETRVLDYTQEALVWDASQRASVLTAFAEIGLAVENALSSPQDIEGAVSRGRYFVVQTRPQVGLA